MLDSSSRASQLPPGIRTGSIVANRYRIEEVIGRGGMGVVLAARHLELDERVAVKFMSSDALSDPEAIARFDREVRAAARLRSEYAARVYDAGKLPDGRRYMVLEYLEGEDLSVRVHRDGPLEIECAIRFILQASSAVLEAHVLGIIHRDLKPANLRVVRRADGSEIVKVLDFGVMKRLPDGQSDTLTHETQPGTVVGTPFYTSPEQLRGSTDVDVRSDIWSLGATLFELLAGQPPFGGKTYPQVIANVLEATPLSLRSLRTEVTEALEKVVMRCLEKQPGERYGSIVELAQALAETISLDSEQTSLLERILRLTIAPTPSSSVPAEAKRRSDPSHDDPMPGFAVVANSRQSKPIPAVQHTDTNGYPGSARPGRRVLLMTASALLTALLVVLVGLPWLPRFDAKPNDSTGSAAVSPAGTAARRAPVDPVANGTPQIAVPSQPQSPSRVASTPSLLASSAQPPLHRRTRPTETLPVVAPTRTSAPTPIPSAPSAATTSPKKNPLLVRPR